jgi:aryl-alcohol dehydrogenase-like predicted oxidoreductase
MMEQRKLGSSGMEVSALGLGCMGMSEFYGAHDDAVSLATLAAACEAGVTLFDTADVYGAGHNEELLGRFLRDGPRGRVRVATKCGLVRAGASYERRIDNTPDYIRRACDASLRRLGVDTIDLFYLHRLNPETPLEDALGALARLVADGKIRAVGLCEVAPETLRRAAAIHPIAALQSEYSLWTREPERGALQACREVGAAFVPYSPLGRGFLTGTILERGALDANDFRFANPRFAPENLARNLAMVEAIRPIAQEKACTPAQLALAWLLAQGPDIIPIPGTRSAMRLQENLGAAAVRLGPDELARLDRALPPGGAAGARYTPEGMKGIDA